MIRTPAALLAAALAAASIAPVTTPTNMGPGPISRSSPRTAPPETSDMDPAVRAVLARTLKFSAAELADMQRGKVARHNLDTKWPAEFGVAGGTRVRAPKSAFFDAARDIVRFKSDPGVLEIGRLSDPPTLEDLARLTVEREDFDASRCHVNDCPIRLPADMIRRAQREIDVKAPNAQEQAAAWFKSALVADVAAYMSGGAGRFAQYDDGAAPIRPLDDFAAILDHMPALAALAPALSDHLGKYPAARPPDAEDFFYWSKEKFGAEPFISVTQVTMLCPSTRTCVMTTKDVYSSRYIDASLAVAIASDAGDRGDAFYLVYANRSRVNALKGGLSALRRSIVERRARAAIDESLKNITVRLENGR
jgi:hypothetical protein